MLENLKIFIKITWKEAKLTLIIYIIQSIISMTSPLVDIIGIGLVVSFLETERELSYIIKVIIYYALVCSALWVIAYTVAYFENVNSRHLSNKLQYGYIYNSLDINFHYVQDGTMLNKRNQSMYIRPPFSSYSILSLLQSGFGVLGIIGVIAAFDRLFLIVLVISLTISVYLTFKQRSVEHDYDLDKTDDGRKMEYLYKTMTDYTYAKEIRVNKVSDLITGKYFKVLSDQLSRLKLYLKKNNKYEIAIYVISASQSLLMYLYYSYQVIADKLTMSEYIMLTGSTILLFSFLMGFFDALSKFRSILEDVDIYLDYENFMDTNSAIHQSNNLPEQDIDFHNAVIKFENVTFKYPNTDNIILDNVSFTFKPKEKVALVGINGSGKTTMIKLLTRLYDPTEGKITINGVDIKTIPHDQYVRNIGIVLQDYTLFAFTVKENIVFDKEVDTELLNKSLALSGIDEKINTLENGLDTYVYKRFSDSGIEFSGGESQKLATARTIYKNAPMLILDEPTSALDPIAEYQLFMKFNEISEDKTTVFISHRLSSTRFCDNILVLNDGVITESGTHAELMAIGGFYSKMYNSQAQYYKNEGIHI